MEMNGMRLPFHFMKIYRDPLKIAQLNIDSKEQPQMVSKDDYWDDEIVFEVVTLLKEYGDLFP
jgi:hypothetical protein